MRGGGKKTNTRLQLLVVFLLRVQLDLQRVHLQQLRVVPFVVGAVRVLTEAMQAFEDLRPGTDKNCPQEGMEGPRRARARARGRASGKELEQEQYSKNKSKTKARAREQEQAQEQQQ